MEKVKKIILILSHILTAILFAFLVLAIYFKVQMLVLGRTYASFFGYTMFQVASGSMEPELYIDDVILVKKTGQYAVNDVITYESNQTIITHRILSINGNLLTVKGDANNTIDDPINRDIVIGEVIKVFPNLKMWQNILSSPKILAAMFITLLLFDFAFSYKGGNAKKKTSVKKSKEHQDEPLKIVQLHPQSKDVIEAEDLLELTRKIDLTELTELLKKEKVTKLEPATQEELYNTLVNFNRENIEEHLIPKLKEKMQEDTSEYTLRLDLKEIQKEIAKKIS